jgi:hypothetical protein
MTTTKKWPKNSAMDQRRFADVPHTQPQTHGGSLPTIVV